MQLTTIVRENMSPELKDRLAGFEINRDVYITLQKQYTEVVQESQRLTQEATRLETQASLTDASWNAMGKSGTIEQSKINEEIERSAQLRKDAQALRFTADARIPIQKNLVIKVAEARLKLVGVPGSINKELQQTLLSQALKQEGTREILLELFTLSHAVALKSLGEHDVALSRCNSQYERQEKIKEITWITLGKKLEKLFNGAEKDILVPTLVTMPPAVPKEAVVDNTAALLKLKRTTAAS
ncbi:hypothetical protein GHO42_21685 [Pseudomonas sp. FSL R10-0056]|uniref:hypothetical protein n=1 Tax=unclassified Pseudomonas TaxID=196821 RepID=UPI001295B9CC|nr:MULTISPECIES: hypothetical protein [unclassified Pseudomonas]MQT65678.1 hypothetical protein [Pseudomonas sp. FSL R10-0056]MQT70900.1 hypothetical protein [Pseudomonas sp. FSL R10-0071]MQU50062.1 hypothetical protein [Pseudomonas sp. FSL A6-1183]